MIEFMEQMPAIPEEKGLILETGKNVRELLAGMRAMGEMMRVMGERMTAMEATIRTLEKVTPGQAAEINRMIRTRAEDLCNEYGLWIFYPGKEIGDIRSEPDANDKKALTAAIRKDVREMTGVKTAREIARCDCQAVKEFIQGWEDYDVIQRIRRGKGR